MAEANPRKKNNVTVTGNPAAARTLILAHGFGTDQTAWHQVEAPFLCDYRVIRYDNVGAGGADPAAYSHHRYDSLSAYADDLLAICATLGVNDAILVGHSVSAMVAVLAATAQPAHFSRLVLLSASPRYINDAGYHGGFEQGDLDALYQAMQTNYQAWVSGFAPLIMANADRPELSDYFAQGLKAIRPDIALAVLRVIMQSDLREDLARLKQPTLLIQPREDPAVPPQVGEYLHQRIAGSRLAVVDATGHLPHLSAPAEVIAAMQAFL